MLPADEPRCIKKAAPNSDDELLIVFDQARQLIQDFGWTNGEASEARDAAEMIVPFDSLSAKKFTPYGAIKRVCWDKFYAEPYVHPGAWMHAYTVLRGEAKRKGFSSLWDFNNSYTASQDEAIALFDTAITYINSKTTLYQPGPPPKVKIPRGAR